ncbi:protein NLRC3-like [Sycon ciliatum]|uniref:protein NLRC3-like n=1 Tax=Sycon ciliatum TaxID=27933 RepID=UPI0031F69AA7
MAQAGSPTASSGHGETSKKPLPATVKKYHDRLRAAYSNVQFCIEETNEEKERILQLDELYADLHVVSKQKLNARMRDAERLGTTAGNERLAHSFASEARKLRKMKLAEILNVKKAMRQRMHGKTFRAIALSSAGAGKTMLFTKKGPFEWARGQIWPHIAVLRALELRLEEVRNIKSIAELLDLQNYGITTEGEQVEVIDFVCNHPESVCIILDGLDEIKLADCSKFMYNVICGKELPGINLIITSRHSAEAMKLTQNRDIVFHRRVELLGFEKQGLEHYIRNVLSPKDAPKFLAELRTNPQLAAMMRTPFFAQAICSLYRHKHSLPNTPGTIVNSLILHLLNQHEGKLPSDGEQYTDWDDVPDDVQENLLDLSRFAFHMLIRRKVVFTDADFKMFSLSLAARTLGLLIACDKASPRSKTQWRFSHLALQEALAARYIASRSPIAADIAWLVQRLGAFTGSLNMFWRLLATELDSESANVLIKAILNPQSPSSSQPQNADQHYTGAEGHNVTCFLFTTHDHIMEWADHVSSFLSLDEAEHLAEELLGDRIGLALSAPEVVRLEIDPAVTKITCKDFVRSMLPIWTDRVPSASTQMLHYAMAHQAQGSAIRCFTVTPTSKLPPVPPSDDAAQPPAALENVSDAERRQRILYACRVFAEHVNARQSSIEDIQSMQAILTEYGVDFDGVPLTPSDCQAINTVIRHHHQFITRIRLRNCCIGDTGYACMADGMALLRNLTLINLELNNLTDRHTAHIAACIASNTSTLRQLYTSGNLFSSNATATVHSNTHRCTRLLGVDFGGQKCTDPAVNLDVITTVCSSLRACPDLRYVGVYVYVLDMEGLTQLAPLLGALRLRDLELDKVGMKQNSATIVSRIIQQQHESLEVLSLRRNELTGDFLETVRGELSQCRRLEKLYLDDDCLSSGALPVLASLLPSLPNLSKLEMGRNDFRDAGDEAKLFAAAAESCSSLKELEMPERALVSPLLRESLSAMVRDDLNVQYSQFRWSDEVENDDEEEDEYDAEGDSESEE